MTKKLIKKLLAISFIFVAMNSFIYMNCPKAAKARTCSKVSSFKWDPGKRPILHIKTGYESCNPIGYE